MRRGLALARGPAAIAGAAAVLALLAVRLPAHGDLAAHFYRTLLVRRGDYLWDNLWYRGDYPVASYSVVYYLLAAHVGNAAVAIASAVVTAVLYAIVVRRTWGSRGRLASYAFAVLCVGPLVKSQYPFALGVTFAVASLAALQRRRAWIAGLLALLCLASSPLALCFLCLTLVGVFASRPSLDRNARVYGGVLLLLVLVLALVDRAVGLRWIGYPFPVSDLAPVLVVAALGVTLARRLDDGGLLMRVFATWGLATLVGFLAPTPVGLNFARPLFLYAPLLLVPVQGRSFRIAPVAAVLGVAAFNLAGTAVNVLGHTPPQGRLWASAIRFLRQHQTPDYRVEVVPTSAHWESYYLPAKGFAISRGWFRQLDLAANPALYRARISPTSYRRWLASRSADYVILARTLGLDGYGASAEARLLRSGRSGLTPVLRTRAFEIFAVPRPMPLLRPARMAAVTALTSQQIVLTVRKPGRYRLDVDYMPYWEAPKSLVVTRASDGTTLLDARHAGHFVIEASGERIFDLP